MPAPDAASSAEDLTDEARHGYRTTPEQTTKMPSGIPYIVGNEAAERFSYYGMRTILIVFMTKFLIDKNGDSAPMTEEHAKVVYHQFLFAVYFFPILGSLLADGLLGKYRTIIILSIVYCLGHLVLALDDTRNGLYLGLGLIAVGAGGIKPCVSAHVGDQFGERNKDLLPKVFGWFYFSINFGSFFSTLLIPAILHRQGVFATWIPPGVRTAPIAFAVPGVLMLLATLVFWMGRNRFANIPPGGARFIRQALSGEGLKVLVRLSMLYLFIAMFWSLYDQTSSAWVLQAEKLDRQFSLFGREWEISAEQVQAINPLLIMLFIPLFNYVVYPGMNRVWTMTPLRKIGVGFLLTVLSFVISYVIELRIAAGATPSMLWQLGAFVVITAAETMVSITALEYSYTQSPNAMKSFVMALYMLSVSLGNLFTSIVNRAIIAFDLTKTITGAAYYAFFAGMMLLSTGIYVFASQHFREKTFVQGNPEDELGKANH